MSKDIPSAAFAVVVKTPTFEIDTEETSDRERHLPSVTSAADLQELKKKSVPMI
jgi:hypothetical protein